MEMKMVNIHIDNILYEVTGGKNLLETCLSLGFDIPYFCFHPALGSVGACRLCAVKKYANPDDKKGRIIMSCMEEVVEGLIISTTDPEVKAFRASVLESLMISHPHDCPVCDEGGECHLQDMLVMTGHAYRRYRFKKQTYNNQELGPFINHEMNRCIQCYRCVRYYRNYAGGKDLNVYGSANHIYFGRHKDGTLENEFSGNLVEVCPTGVFTDKTLKNHYARKWDLTNAPSVCVHCSLGCNTIMGSRYGSVRRVLSRYNGSVNGYFLCDRGRFGYEFLNGQEKIKNTYFRSEKALNKEDKPEEKYTSWLKEAIINKKIVGIGSPRASLESNYALSGLVGESNFYHGISASDQNLVKRAIKVLQSGVAKIPSLREMEDCDAVFIIGEDVTNTAPMIALAVRQASRHRYLNEAARLGIRKWNDTPARELDHDLRSPLFIASPFNTKLDDVASEVYNGSPDNIADLGYYVASLIDTSIRIKPETDKKLLKTARLIAESLMASENPLIVSGVSSNNEDQINASFNIALSLSKKGKKPSLSLVFTESNSVGLGMMKGGSLNDVIDLAAKGNLETVVILENDLYRRTEKINADLILDKSVNIVVLDHISNETTTKAGLLFPVTSSAECTGTIINNEGRAQRYFSALPETDTVRPSWQWLSYIMNLAENGENERLPGYDDIVNSMALKNPAFGLIRDKLPSAAFRFYNEKIPRQTPRFSGRTAMDAYKSVSEPKPPEDNYSPLAFTMEAYKGLPPSDLVPFYWSPGWNSIQSMNKYMEEPNGHLKNGGDPGVLMLKNESSVSDDYFSKTGNKTIPAEDEVMIIPVWQIFGSEELSSLGKAISERSGSPYVIINEEDIKKLGISGDESCRIIVKNTIIIVKVIVNSFIPEGVAGLSYYLPGVPYLALPLPGKLKKHEKEI